MNRRFEDIRMFLVGCILLPVLALSALGGLVIHGIDRLRKAVRK